MEEGETGIIEQEIPDLTRLYQNIYPCSQPIKSFMHKGVHYRTIHNNSKYWEIRQMVDNGKSLSQLWYISLMK